MPIYVYLISGFRARALRWVAVAGAVRSFVFWILHHLWHWHRGTRPDATSHVIDITLHLVGLWVLVKSIQWAGADLDGSRDVCAIDDCRSNLQPAGDVWRFSEAGIACSMIVLGIAIATVTGKVSSWPVLIVVGFFGRLHGHAHGQKLPKAADPRQLPA
jgi:hypothetical protein